MANLKNAGVREIIIDRCLKDGRGYTIEELKERVNKALRLDGLSQVTSPVTIYYDLENIANRWKQSIKKEKRGKAYVYSYADPKFSIFNDQLTRGELKQIQGVVRDLKFLDAYQGSLIYKELDERLTDLLNIDHYQAPILFYENLNGPNDLLHFRLLYECIRDKRAINVEHSTKRKRRCRRRLSPYLMRQHKQKWHLLGRETDTAKMEALPLEDIQSIEIDESVPYESGEPFDIDELFATLF